jgi:hypothetical protein
MERNELAQLLDLEAIKLLKARYCLTLDAEDWDGFRSVFVTGPDFDADEFVARVIRHHTDAEVVTVHHCAAPALELTGPDTAAGLWPLQDYVDRIWHDDGVREAFRGYGNYIESYLRVDGAWKIASTRHHRIRIDWLDPARLTPFPHRDRPIATTARGAGGGWFT